MSDQKVIAERQTNGLGTAGFVVSLVGLVLTCGALCPIGMVMSFFAMFKEPRGLAIAGLVLGFVGGGWLVLMMIFGLGFLIAVIPGIGIIETTSSMEKLETQIVRYHEENGEWPDSVYVARTFEIEDSWGNPIRYEVRGTGFELRSAGPDGSVPTRDDIVRTWN